MPSDWQALDATEKQVEVEFNAGRPDPTIQFIHIEVPAGIRLAWSSDEIAEEVVPASDLRPLCYSGSPTQASA